MSQVFVLSRKSTGRRFGDKKPEATARLKLEGVAIKATAWDAWEGPIEPGDQGEYHRIVSVEKP